MDITRENFDDALPIMQKAIEESSFFAIDTEFTGLKTLGHSFNTLEERYSMIREESKSYAVIQFGLSCFKYHDKEKKYTHKDFNIYVFQHKYLEQHIKDTNFASSGASIAYLASHKFSFDKVFHSGVNYLTPEQEQMIKEYLIDSHNGKFEALLLKIKEEENAVPQKVTFEVPDDHQEFVNDIQNQINTFISNDEDKELSLAPCSAYRRKLIYETILPQHPKGIVMSTAKNADGDFFIKIQKLTDEERIEQTKKKHSSDLEELDKAIGFRKVLDMISASKKAVVGHNMLLDLMHIVNQFYFPLPPSLTEFKTMVRALFPKIIDTKTLAKLSTKNFFASTALFQLWNEIKTKASPVPKCESAEGCDCYSVDCNKPHEAGYDAYVTGLCFTSLCAKLAQEHHVEYLSPESKTLFQYSNRPYIMRHFDITSLNLCGHDPEPRRDNVFFATFPKEWKTVDLIQLFSPYGDVHVSWLNDVSAFVVLKTSSEAVNVKKNLLRQKNSVYKVCSYADYMQSTKVKSPVDNNSVQNNSNKRKKSNGETSSDSPTKKRSMAPIPEEDESATLDKQDNCVTTSHESSSSSMIIQTESQTRKKKKVSNKDDENSEVSSTDKLFEEPSVW